MVMATQVAGLVCMEGACMQPVLLRAADPLSQALLARALSHLSARTSEACLLRGRSSGCRTGHKRISQARAPPWDLSQVIKHLLAFKYIHFRYHNSRLLKALLQRLFISLDLRRLYPLLASSLQRCLAMLLTVRSRSRSRTSCPNTWSSSLHTVNLKVLSSPLVSSTCILRSQLAALHCQAFRSRLSMLNHSSHQ